MKGKNETPKGTTSKSYVFVVLDNVQSWRVGEKFTTLVVPA